MGRNLRTNKEVDLIKVEPKIEIVDRNNTSDSTNANWSYGKQLLFTATIEAIKTGVPALSDILKAGQAEKRKLKETIRETLQSDYDYLKEMIAKEDAKENYDQERINRWIEQKESVREEMRKLDENPNSFFKSLLKTFQPSKSGSK